MPSHRSTLLVAGCCGQQCSRGRREAAAAAAEVFREAIEAVAADSSLHNGLGASLLVLARFESHPAALQVLDDAAQAFQIALRRAEEQAAPRAVRLRYAINLATAQWMQGERTRDEALLRRAADLLRSVAAGLSPSSPYWAHVHDNLGNALAALGSTAEAIVPLKPPWAAAKPRRIVRVH